MVHLASKLNQLLAQNPQLNYLIPNEHHHNQTLVHMHIQTKCFNLNYHLDFDLQWNK
jgi:hypothetical protein